MLRECCASHVSWFHGSFGTQKTMVTFISKFDPKKGQFQAKLGKFQDKIFQKIKFSRFKIFKIQNFQDSNF